MSSNTLHIVFDGTRYTIGGIEHENTFGIVAFLDVLGIKGVWETKDPRRVLDDWNKVYYIFSDNLKSLDINVAAFSDTLIISMRGHKELARRPWRFIEIFCNAIMLPFLESMRYDFFLRGAIAMGFFSRSSRMLIGPAADEAAQFYEASNWVGITVSPPTGLILDNNVVENEVTNFLVKYNIPQKTKMIIGWALNWTISAQAHRYQQILQEKANAYAIGNDHSKYMKYKNTLDFYTALTSSYY